MLLHVNISGLDSQCIPQNSPCEVDGPWVENETTVCMEAVFNQNCLKINSFESYTWYVPTTIFSWGAQILTYHSCPLGLNDAYACAESSLVQPCILYLMILYAYQPPACTWKGWHTQRNIPACRTPPAGFFASFKPYIFGTFLKNSYIN